MSMKERVTSVESLTEELREYAITLGIDFMDFCPVESVADAPEDRSPNIYLDDVKSIISIGRL